MHSIFIVWCMIYLMQAYLSGRKFSSTFLAVFLIVFFAVTLHSMIASPSTTFWSLSGNHNRHVSDRRLYSNGCCQFSLHVCIVLGHYSTETRIRNKKHSVICYNVFITSRFFVQTQTQKLYVTFQGQPTRCQKSFPLDVYGCCRFSVCGKVLIIIFYTLADHSCLILLERTK